MTENKKTNRKPGRPIENPDSNLHAWWREQKRLQRAKNKAKKVAEQEGENK